MLTKSQQKVQIMIAVSVVLPNHMALVYKCNLPEREQIV